MSGEQKVSVHKRRTYAEVQELAAEFMSSGMRRASFAAISTHTGVCPGSQPSRLPVGSVSISVKSREMGLTPKTKFLLDWVKRSRLTFLRLVLVAVAMFVIVPQMASVDSDDDGIPDLPAIAIGANSIVVPSRFTRKDSGAREIRNRAGLALIATQPHQLEADRSDCTVHDGRSTLQSSCTLRC